MGSTGRFRVILGLLGLLGVGIAFGAAPVSGEFIQETLPNGLQVSIFADPSQPLVATQVWYHVGSSHEEPGSRGLAHLFEHMMFGETESRPPREYAEFHHRHGGRENAYTTPDETVYVSEIAPEFHLGVLEREADRMAHLVISQTNLENEQRIVTEELRVRIENDPLTRLFTRAAEALLGEHPYAIPPTGTRDQIAAASVESSRRFYDRYYHPGNAHLVVVGPVDVDSTLETIRAHFGAIPSGESARPAVPALLDWKFPEETLLYEDLPPVEVSLLGFALPAPGSADDAAVRLLTRMLADGQVDPFRELLVVGRAAAVEAGIEPLTLRRGGALVFYGLNLPYRRKTTALERMERGLRELGRFEWLGPEELSGAKRALLLEGSQGRFFPAARAQRIGQSHWWLGEARRAFDDDEQILAVTEQQVRDAWKRYIADAKPVRLFLRPERVPLWIRLFGWLYPVVR